jgi:hypothetical protein
MIYSSAEPRTPGEDRTMRARSLTRAALLLAALAGIGACNQQQPSDISGKPQTAAPSEPTHQDFGDFQVHYNALRTDELAASVARAYGIERSANRVLLNVAMLARRADGSTVPVDGSVSVRAYNLNGQLKDLQMRRITEGDSLYFIGEVGIAGAEILVFDIDAQPNGAPGSYQVQFKREFFAD